ncbi:MAG: tetratricopeptide repeat protein [Acidobacteria bacterium]|nr:tetratricopeptide repeat protein [Acidobacteriota bacterium]
MHRLGPLLRTGVLCFGLAVVPGRPQAGREAVMEAISARRFSVALELLDGILGTEKTNPALWTLRGVVLTELRREAESLASFRNALSLDPGFLPALERAAEIELRRNDPSARSTLGRILGQRPADPVAHLMAGVAAFREKDCSATLDHFAKARSTVHDNAIALSHEGQCQFEAGKALEASEIYRRLLELRPDDRRARFNLGLSLHEAGKQREAAAALQPLTAAPHDGDALRLLAGVFESMGDVKRAVGLLQEAIAAQPEDERAYLHLAALCLSRDSAALGIQVLTGGLKKVTRSGKLHAARGMLHAHLGQYEPAEKDFEAADPASAALGLAVTRQVQGRAGDAIPALRERLRRAPGDASSAAALARALREDGATPGSAAFDEAISALQRAVALDPRHLDARVELGKALLGAGRPDEAVIHLRTAAEADPRGRASAYLLIRALMRTKQSEEVRKQVEHYRSLLEREAPRPHTFDSGRAGK